MPDSNKKPKKTLEEAIESAYARLSSMTAQEFDSYVHGQKNPEFAPILREMGVFDGGEVAAAALESFNLVPAQPQPISGNVRPVLGFPLAPAVVEVSDSRTLSWDLSSAHVKYGYYSWSGVTDISTVYPTGTWDVGSLYISSYQHMTSIVYGAPANSLKVNEPNLLVRPTPESAKAKTQIDSEQNSIKPEDQKWLKAA